MLPRIHGPQGPRTHPGHRLPRSLGSLVIGLSASLAPGSLGPRILDPRALGYSPLSPWAPESRAHGPENSGPLASWPVGSSDVGSPRRVGSSSRRLWAGGFGPLAPRVLGPPALEPVGPRLPGNMASRAFGLFYPPAHRIPLVFRPAGPSVSGFPRRVGSPSRGFWP